MQLSPSEASMNRLLPGEITGEFPIMSGLGERVERETIQPPERTTFSEAVSRGGGG